MRLLVEDDQAQLAAIHRRMRNALRDGETLFVPITVALYEHESADFTDCLHIALAHNSASHLYGPSTRRHAGLTQRNC